MKARRTLIGLTGNIATGKSAVGRMLAELGAAVIDADQVAHEVMEPGGPAFAAVVDAFGPEILSPAGTVDRQTLGGIVFRDPAALARLEAAVHPAVIQEVGERILAADAAVVVVEAIKLIEAGMHRAYDALWVVTAPREVQIERLVRLRGLAPGEAALRVDAQPPQEDKAALADRVLVNDGSRAHLHAQVRAAWEELFDGDEGSRPAMHEEREASAASAGTERGESIEIRRAHRQDLAAIARVVERSSQSRLAVDEAQAMQWLFGKGLLAATADGAVVGVVAWQVENLVCVTDLFHVEPACYLERVGSRLMQTVEAEASVLMCEANVVVLPPWTPDQVRAFLQAMGYEQAPLDELHSIWREVLAEWTQGEEELMVKRLREQMVMAPV